MKTTVSFAASIELGKRPDAALLLTKPCERGFDVQVISFTTRTALEAFNKKANLNAVVKTQVPLNCVLYRHQSDSEALTTIHKLGGVSAEAAIAERALSYLKALAPSEGKATR
jgi:hypothetical protein